MRGMLLKLYLALCLALSASVMGCASAPPSPLTLADANKIKIQSIKVAVAPDAAISWGSMEGEFVNQKRSKKELPKASHIETGSIGLQGRDPNDDVNAELIKSPEGQEFLKAQVAKRLTGALENEFAANRNIGTRPAKLEVTVRNFFIPSAAQRVLIGGAPIIVASAVLRDAQSGAIIAERQNLGSAAFAGNGVAGVLADQFFSDLDVRVVNAYASQYKEWLFPKT